MDVPPGHISVYRKTAELLCEAESPEQAQGRFAEVAGDWINLQGPPFRERPEPGGFTHVYGTWYDFFVEEVQGCTPTDTPVHCECWRERDPLPYYSAQAIVALPADAFSSTPPDEVEAAVEEAFSAFNLLADWDDLAFHYTPPVGGPAERGTMPTPTPPPFAEFSISPAARAFIRDGGGSVYVYPTPLRSMFLPDPPLFSASVDPPPPYFTFEPGVEDKDICIYVEESMNPPKLEIDLRTFPLRMLMFPRTRLTADYAQPSWLKQDTLELVD